MSKILKAPVGILMTLILATAFSPSVIAGEQELYQSPLYVIQLRNFAERTETTGPGEIELLAYTVQNGDSLIAIARRFGTGVETLVRLNQIVNPHLIHTGQTIQVITVPGAVHRVESGETRESIAELYGVEPALIVPVNRESTGSLLQRGERVIVPGADNLPENIGLQWPVLGGEISSGFGWRGGKFHYGIDLAVPLGYPIYASAGGVVVFSGYLGSYGLMVEVEHGGGWQTRYAHAGKVHVSAGQPVVGGQLLGEVGLTGNTTGSHLHFEVVHGGLRIDPLEVLP